MKPLQNGKPKALVLGATGGIGSELTRQLNQAGWHINALKRETSQTQKNDHITWFQGDALNESDVEKAAQGCSAIFHCVNPAGYKNWDTLGLPMLENTITVAKKTQACVVFPGNIYNYGEDTFPLLQETSPQHPSTNKGRIRVKMENRLEDFAKQGGQVIIVRAGDFFGATAPSSWFSQGLIKPNKAVRTINNPSKSNIGHQWSYLPDVAATMVKLIDTRDTLKAFSTFHMAGFWDEDGTQMANAIRRSVKKNTGGTPKIRAFPWWIMSLMAPFNETLKELMEMKYLWQRPIRMDNSKLVQKIGKEPATPIDIAVEETLKGLNCFGEKLK